MSICYNIEDLYCCSLKKIIVPHVWGKVVTNSIPLKNLLLYVAPRTNTYSRGIFVPYQEIFIPVLVEVSANKIFKSKSTVKNIYIFKLMYFQGHSKNNNKKTHQNVTIQIWLKLGADLVSYSIVCFVVFCFFLDSNYNSVGNTVQCFVVFFCFVFCFFFGLFVCNCL